MGMEPAKPIRICDVYLISTLSLFTRPIHFCFYKSPIRLTPNVSRSAHHPLLVNLISIRLP